MCFTSKCLLSGEVLSYLDAVSGQKHPTASHVRQLKATLPLLAVFIHLVASQVRMIMLNCLETHSS